MAGMASSAATVITRAFGPGRDDPVVRVPVGCMPALGAVPR